MITLGLVDSVDANGVYVTMPGSRGVLRGPYRMVSGVASGDTALVVGTDEGENVVAGAVGASLARLDVRDYGAVGDGTTDDTAAIQAALDAADSLASNSGGTGGARGVTVWFPRGTYRITAALDPITKDNIYLAAESPASAQLNLPDAVTAFTWDGSGPSHGGGLINLRLYYPAGSSSSTVAVKVGYAADWSMHGCSVLNPVRLLTLGDSLSTVNGATVSDCRISGRSDVAAPMIDAVDCNGLRIRNTTAVAYPGSGDPFPTGTDTHHASNGRDFVKVTKLDTLEVSLTMLYGFDRGVHLAPTSGKVAQNVTLVSAWIDMCKRAALALLPASGGTVSGVYSSESFFCATDGAGVDVTAASGGTVVGVSLVTPQVIYCGTDGVKVSGTVSDVTMLGGSVTLVNRLGAGGYILNIDDTGTKSGLKFVAAQLGGDGTAHSATCTATDTHPGTTAAGAARYVACSTAGGTVTSLVPDVTGSRGGNAALASLLTGLESAGYITDSTT